MVYTSPAKRSALGSISSILNTTPKTPCTKQGRVGKCATPRVTGIRQKLASLFGANKENPPRQKDLLECRAHLPQNSGLEDHCETFPGRDDGRDPSMMEIDSIKFVKEGGVVELRVASVVDVFSSNTVDHQQSTTASATASISPEIRQIAAMLKSRLQLAAYKVSTQQIHTPLSELSSLPVQSPSDAVSHAIQQFRESTRMQNYAQHYRSRKLEIACRRDSRRARRSKTTISTLTDQPDLQLQAPTPTLPQFYPLSRTVSIMTAIHSDQEDGLPSPPDSQQANKSPMLLLEAPSTPAPKPKIRKLKRRRVYNEQNGHLGLSSPPQQEYDRPDAPGQWMTEEVEVGDVPSSVLRGVEGLWALTG